MATRKEVARLAGVAEATVSRVFSGTIPVSTGKKEKVMEAAKQLGYFPNQVASSLRRNSSKQILLLLADSDFQNPYFVDFYEGAIHCAESAGYLLSTSTDQKFSTIRRRMYDGIILQNAAFSPNEVRENIRTPAVVYCSGEHPAYPWLENVTIDSALALEMMIYHLRAAGHTKIGLALPCHKMGIEAAQTARYQRYVSLMNNVPGFNAESFIFEADAASLAENIGEAVDYFHSGVIAAELVYQKKSDISAIVCFNDELALGLMWRLQSRGVRIPEDLSVGGIDGIRKGKYSIPPLTTIQLPSHQSGGECVRRLVGQIEGEKRESVNEEWQKYKIVSRESVRAIAT